MDEWLTTEQCAELIGVSRTTIWNAIRDGRLEATTYRVHSRTTIRIRRSAVDQFLARGREAGDEVDDLGDWR